MCLEFNEFDCHLKVLKLNYLSKNINPNPNQEVECVFTKSPNCSISCKFIQIHPKKEQQKYYFKDKKKQWIKDYL